MYKGYNLILTMESFAKRLSGVDIVAHSLIEVYIKNAKSSFKDYCNEIRRKILSVKTTTTYIIDGNEIEEKWFPKINAQVFISHSHADERLAYALSGWLNSALGVSSFIDSAVWGYREDLIRKLSEGESVFDWPRMVEYVDCMLMKSLMQMIDQCECLIFINTPNSICAKGVVSKTYSPWIFSELNASRYIRTNVPGRYELRKVATMDEAVKNSQSNFSKKMILNAPVNHLGELDINSLLRWRISAGGCKGVDALDRLYSLGLS